MSRIINLKHEPGAVADGAARIDRRTPWGNPFVIGRDGGRREVVARYRADLWRRIRAGDVALDALAALHGRDLACHCAPLPCHGEVLARAAAWAAARLGGPEPFATEATGISITAAGSGKWAIRLDGHNVGDVRLHDDIARPGSRVFIIHLDEDPRGPRRVRELAKVRDAVERMVDTHPLW